MTATPTLPYPIASLGWQAGIWGAAGTTTTTYAPPTQYATADQVAQIQSYTDAIQVPNPNPTSGGAQATYNPYPGFLGATQVANAYGDNAALLGSANQGQGVTIAIIDEDDDPGITTDVNGYSSYYGLPLMDGVGSDPTLKVFKDTALGAVPSFPSGSGGDAGETTLDVESAHAMAPKANILLVEVPAPRSDTTSFADLLAGVQYAAGQSVNGAPVVTVSLSYGLPDPGAYPGTYVSATNETTQNNTYLASGAATNVAVFVSSGDDSFVNYPSTSPNVIAVGGTGLYTSSVKGRYNFETAWGDLSQDGAGSGGTSTVFASPTYQSSNGVSYAKRSTPDISGEADAATAMSFYDSYDAGSGNDPWTAYGGTSVASPLMAGEFAVGQEERLNQGKTILTTAQIQNLIYGTYNSSSYSTVFHDVTIGNNSDIDDTDRLGGASVTGYNAAAGYDQATGVGSVIANQFIPLMAAQ